MNITYRWYIKVVVDYISCYNFKLRTKYFYKNNLTKTNKNAIK